MSTIRCGCWGLFALLLPAGVAAADDSRLADAAKARNSALVRTLVRDRADVNGRQPDGTTALHWAVLADDVDTVSLLLQAGADPNATNDLGVTPLSLACGNASVSIAAALLDAGSRVDQPLPSGETPLMTAARTGRAELVSQLLARGADVQAKEAVQGQTALMWAVAEGHAGVVDRLLEQGADVHARSTGGSTPLLFAARGGDVTIAARLLDAGAGVNDVAKDGTSALLIATVRGHVPFATFMLDKGADPNLRGPGYTALHWAAGSWETELSGPRGVRIGRDEEWEGIRGVGAGRIDLIRALLAHGADPNAAVEKAPPRVGFTVFRSSLAGATPFLLAAMAGHADVMRLLVAAGADPLRSMKDGTTPLMAAAGVGRVLAETRLPPDASAEAAKLATELGNDVNAANAAGETALHGAAHIRSDTLVRFLAEKGARLDVKNRRGETPLFIAERTLAAGSAPVFVRTTTGDLLRALGAAAPQPDSGK